MLPVHEDAGLANIVMNKSNKILTLSDMLLNSTVCGIGLDTISIPGNTTPEKLALTYLDMQSLSLKWNKPLACRLFPVKNKKAGDITNFESPYLKNTKVFPL